MDLMQRMLCVLTVLLLATVGCKPHVPSVFPSDGPQVEEPITASKGREFGSRCPTGCFVAAATIGFFSLGYSGLSFAMGPRKLARATNKVWSWAGVAIGATLLAIGGTHALLNRDELDSDAIAPAAIALPTGAAALTAGLLGVATPHADMIAPMSGAMITCHGPHCHAAVPVPMITPTGTTLTLASGRF